MRLLRVFIFAAAMPVATSLQASDEDVKRVAACPHTVETYKEMLRNGILQNFAYNLAECDDTPAKVMHSKDVCTVIECALSDEEEVVCETKTVDPPIKWDCPFTPDTSKNERKPQ